MNSQQSFNIHRVFFQLLGWAAFGTFLVIKGAFLNSQPPIEAAGSGYNSYKVPSYGSGYHSPNYQTGRTIVHQSSLTEDFGGIKNDLYPLNYTIPYMGKYLVCTSSEIFRIENIRHDLSSILSSGTRADLSR